MKEIPLSKSRGVAFVDDEDYEWLSSWFWQLHSHGYACRRFGSNGAKRTIYMHRLITDAPVGVDIDHINRNPADNRRSNLRVVSRSVNLRNSGPMRTNSSGIRGVYWNKKDRRWHAQTSHNDRMIYLGQFTDIADAAAAYQKFNDAVAPKPKDK